MKKVFIIVVLIFCLLPTTEYAYSYVAPNQSIVLNNEQALYHFYEQISNQDNTLIPKGALQKENDTYYLRYSYQIYIEDGMNYDISIKDVSSSLNNISSDQLEDLFNFEIFVDQGDIVELNTGFFTENESAYLVQVTVIVSMNDIPDFNQYQELMNSRIDFRISLHVYE